MKHLKGLRAMISRRRDLRQSGVKSPSSRRDARRAMAQAIEGLEPRIMLSTAPNDTFYGYQYYVNNTGQTGGTISADLNAQNAWDITTGSHNVVIGVLDSGLDITHPDIAPNLFTNPGEIPGNGIDDDGNGYVDDVHGWDFYKNTSDVTDYIGHGTHVAGTIGAAGNNGEGVAGVNWNVQLLPLKIGIDKTEGVSFDAAIAGLEYAVQLKHQGVNIVAINASIGGTTFPFDTRFDKAIKDCGDAGILFVVAAGNESANTDNNQAFPAKYSLNNPNVITVAATDNKDQLADFSNFGAASVDVAAPGVDIFSTWSRAVDSDLDNIPDGLAYNTISGTSMATPMVTGIIGLEAAANPNATALQLKQALLESAHILPSLHNQLGYNEPNKVFTGGRADAYGAVRNIQNLFINSDSSSRGSWKGLYGNDGEFVVGASMAPPAFVGVAVTGATGQIISPVTTDLHALQNPNDPNPNDRILAQFTTPNTMTFEFDFKDGQTHRTTLYATDLQNLGRTQEIRLVDADTGAQLDYQGMWDFQNGRYLSWDLTGHVKLEVTSTQPGADAIVNGIFFDKPITGPNRFAFADNTTRGNWKNTYGSEGAYIVGQANPFPAFVGVNLTGGTGVYAGDKPKNVAKDPRALDNPDISNKNRILGYFTTPDVETFDLNFNDNRAHRMGMYFVDYERLGRAQRVDLLDAGGNVLSSQTLSDFGNGKYLFFNVDGHQQVRITRLAGPSAVVSGFFFDAPPGGPAQFQGSDSLTRGNWRGPTYGNQGAIVYGEPAHYSPDFVDVSTENGSEQLYQFSTRDSRAPYKTTSLTDRTIGTLATTGSLGINLSFTDNQTHRVSIYALDYDRQNRAERFEIVDPATGQTLSSQDIADFQNGKYLSWDLRGQVQIRITRLAGPTATISGLFFDS